MAVEHNPYDPEGDAIAEKEREGTRLSESAQWESDVRWLMGHTQGRRVVNRLLKDSKVEISAFNANALQMAFNAGYQKVGMDLLKVIKRAALGQYFTMLQEH